MLITKRGEKPHDYRKFCCSRCSSEFICDAKDAYSVFTNHDLFVSCPVCGTILDYEKHGLGCISTEEYNKIKSQYEQMGRYNMIVIKHGHRSELKHWKFKCPACGCEWIADETEVARVYSYRDICTHSLIYYHAISCCPECDHNVEDERRVDADEYEKICAQIDPSPFIKDIIEEEKPF